MSVKLLKDLDFASKINSVEAVTEAGKELLKSYRGYMYTNPASCGIVNGFIKEASQYGFDTGLVSILESVNKFINENSISWKLASACESIMNNNSTYNTLSKLGVEQVQKLLEMSEKDVVAYIKAGSLKNIQYVPEFRMVCREVYKQHINEAQAPNYNISNPICYVYEGENNSQYFTVLGHTYKSQDGVVEESQCSDETFNQINNMLSSFQKDGDKIFLEMNCTHGDKIRLTLANDDTKSINLTKGNINETFNESVAFLNYVDNLSKTMYTGDRMFFLNMCDVTNHVFEAMDNICTLDNVKVLSSMNGSVCVLVEGKKNVNLTVAQSINFGKSSKNYDHIVEALNQVIKISGVDMRFMYEDRINEECNADQNGMKVIKEQLEANNEAKMSIRKQKIKMLAEKYKDDPVRIALLNKVAKDIAILESK